MCTFYELSNAENCRSKMKLSVMRICLYVYTGTQLDNWSLLRYFILLADMIGVSC